MFSSTLHRSNCSKPAALSALPYLTGQALAAYEGGAGGYAVGLFGAGVKFGSAVYDRLSANAEIAVGAAGGGSIDVGGGAVAQPSVGIAYRYNANLSFNIGYGHIRALAGALDSPVYEIGLTYRFATIRKGKGRGSLPTRHKSREQQTSLTEHLPCGWQALPRTIN